MPAVFDKVHSQILNSVVQEGSLPPTGSHFKPESMEAHSAHHSLLAGYALPLQGCQMCSFWHRLWRLAALG